MGNFSQFFLQTSQIICLRMENFVFAVFGVFFPQIHVFRGPMGKKSRFSKNGGEMGFHHHFQKLKRTYI